jgi:phosphatidylinositol alpha-mannosyltransferase
VSVLSPVDDEDALVDSAALPSYVVPAGRTVPIPYNGSVARLLFGVVSAARVRRWLREGEFDVLHVHEPAAPSVSLLACYWATGAIVATMHTSNPRSRVLSLLVPAVQPAYEKIRGRIAVSEAARRTMVEHLGGDAVLIPNGVTVRRYADATPLPGWPGEGGALGFLGRIDEPRKGLVVLLQAFARLADERPGLRLLVAGPGDGDEVDDVLPAALRDRVHLLGQLSEEDKVRMLASVDVFVAPNLGKESFGIVLLEAMAAGTPVLASNIEAFRRVLDDGTGGVLVPVGDAAALADAAGGLLDDRERRRALTAAAGQLVRAYDWPEIARLVVQVYETVAVDGLGVRTVAAPPPQVVPH